MAQSHKDDLMMTTHPNKAKGKNYIIAKDLKTRTAVGAKVDENDFNGYIYLHLLMSRQNEFSKSFFTYQGSV